MPTILQFKRYANTTVAGITGANGEFIIDSTNKTITVHDGVTVGGSRLATESYVNVRANTGSSNTGTGLSSRTTISTQTSYVPNGSNTLITLTAEKGYALYSINTSVGSWVTIYSSSASQNNDINRIITVDPIPGSGVIAEAITIGSGANTVYFTPAVIGFNSDNTVNKNMYVKLYNNSGTSPVGINLSITYLKLEV